MARFSEYLGSEERKLPHSRPLASERRFHLGQDALMDRTSPNAVKNRSACSKVKPLLTTLQLRDLLCYIAMLKGDVPAGSHWTSGPVPTSGSGENRTYPGPQKAGVLFTPNVLS
jgi:hypothetical protein